MVSCASCHTPLPKVSEWLTFVRWHCDKCFYAGIRARRAPTDFKTCVYCGSLRHADDFVSPKSICCRRCQERRGRFAEP